MTKRLGRAIVGLAVGGGMLVSIGAIVDQADVPETRIAMSTPTEKLTDFAVDELRHELRPR